MQRADQAYVLRTQELGDADLIVTLLTESCGRVRGVARSARRSRRRFGGALEPLTRVQARWSEKDGRDLQRIEGLDAVRSYAALQSDPALQAACAVLAEVAASVAREQQPDPRGFRLLGAVLDALGGGLDPWAAVRYFEYWTLRLHGLMPDLARCDGCGRGLSGDSRPIVCPGRGVSCAACAPGMGGGRALRRADLEFLAAAAGSRPQALDPHRGAARPGGVLETLLRGTLEAFVERAFVSYRHLASLGGGRAAEGGPP